MMQRSPAFGRHTAVGSQVAGQSCSLNSPVAAGRFQRTLCSRWLATTAASAIAFSATLSLNPAPVLADSTATLSAAQSPVSETADPRETPLVRAVQRAKSAVVNIHSVKTAYDEAGVFAARQGRKVNGMGTGIVVDARGYIVTNHHVVSGVDSLRVTLVDGGTYDATTIATDPVHDLAIIKIRPTGTLTEMPLGTSSDLMLGETVIAVGNAFGYEHTVTAGIISALGRDVEVNETQSYQNLIQTDASINPGNSGGPLLNLRGEVVGINVAIRAGAQRIGFAIPVDDAREVIATLISTERLDRTAIGMETEDYKTATKKELIVRSTPVSGPAAIAGLRAGDVVLSAAGRPIADRADLERALLGRQAGQNVQLTVRRNGNTESLAITLAPVTGTDVVAANNSSADVAADDAWSVLGLKLTTGKGEDVAGTKYRGGLRVTLVRDGSPAATNGIRPGDVLVGLHQWETVTADNVSWVLKHPQANSFSPLKFYIVRGHETLYGHLKLASK